MFSAKTLLAELKANEDLLQARNMDPRLIQGLTQQANFKLSKMHGMPSTDAVMLLDHLKASKLPGSMIQAITMELDNLMMGKSNIAMKVTTTASACDWLHKYLTQEDWSQLESTNAWEGCLVLAKRLRAIGIKAMKESTKRAGVAMLLCIQKQQGYKDLPPYHTIYSMVEYFTHALACQPDVPPGVPCLQVYPENPMDLGPDAMERLYPSKKPEARFFVDMPLLQAHHIPVRSTSKLLQGAETNIRPHQPDGNVKVQANATEPAALQPKAFASNLQQWDAHTKQASQCNEPSTGQPLPLQDTQDATPVAAAPKASVHVPAAQQEDAKQTEDQEVVKNKGGKATKTLEQWNQHAFTSLLKKQEMKKPAETKAAKPAKAKPTTKAKKPKAKAKATIKKAGPFGCLRCRGNLKGCETCRKPGFKGLKVNGREAWYRLAPNAK